LVSVLVSCNAKNRKWNVLHVKKLLSISFGLNPSTTPSKALPYLVAIMMTSIGLAILQHMLISSGTSFSLGIILIG